MKALWEGEGLQWDSFWPLKFGPYRLQPCPANIWSPLNLLWALGMYKIHAGHPLLSGCEPCSCSLHNSVNLIPTIRRLQKLKASILESKRHQTHWPLTNLTDCFYMVLSKILSTSFDTLVKGMVLYEMLWDFWGCQNCVVKLWWSAQLCMVFPNLEMQMDEQGT